MSDYIKREQAAQVFIDWAAKREIFGSLEYAEELEKIPAADVKPVVRGKWVWDGDTLDWEKRYFCNKCEWKTYNRSDFCPNCGADMRGENHD